MDQSLIWTGFLASLAAGAMTGVGALPALLPAVGVSPRLQDVMLGFAAGVMLTASAFSLIVPGLEAAAADYGGEVPAALTVGCGILLGRARALAGRRNTCPTSTSSSGARG